MVAESTKFSRRLIFTGAVWSLLTIGVAQVLRFITNVALARLLAPELFGIMVIVNSVSTGIALFSDIGIGQNIVHNRDAEKPEFYNTAWSINLGRSIFLWIICTAIAAPISNFYHIPILFPVFIVSALAFLLNGFTSIGLPLLQKRFQFVRVSILDISFAFFSTIVHIALAWISPTIWALVFAILAVAGARMIVSYFIVPGLQHRLLISKKYTWQIIHFGKWIFVSTIVYFLATNLDRLYLGKVVPLELLGIYGIARTISDVLGAIIVRLGNYVVFPLIAASADMAREQLRVRLRSYRLIFILLAAFGLSIFASFADLLIAVLYDQRYQAASWMLPILILGAWFSTMCSLNESMLLGLGKPLYSAAGNFVKLVWLLVGLPFAYLRFGVAGALVVVAVSDFWRYIPVLIGQIRERFSFGMQDLFATLSMFGFVGLWEWLRISIGFSDSFGNLAHLLFTSWSMTTGPH